jgi:hypothetical protein
VIILTKDLTNEFFPAVTELAKKLGCSSVYDLLGVMFYESGVSATACNKFTKACGLIQFMPATLKALGWNDGNYFQLLTAEEQLPYVERYLKPKGVLSSLGHVYTAVFMPAELRNANNPDTVLSKKLGKRGWAYEVNKNLDRNGDGIITIGELSDTVRAGCKGPRWLELVARMGKPVPWKAPGPAKFSIAWVQEKLGILADGIIGPVTQNAIGRFQKAKGLPGQGRLNPETLKALDNA